MGRTFAERLAVYSEPKLPAFSLWPPAKTI